MSRFVEVELALGRATLPEVTRGLASLGVAYEQIDEPLVLAGGIECGDVPVDVRLPAGVADNAEAFGFVTADDGRARLVCSDADRRRLERGLLVRLHAELCRAELSATPGLVVESTTTTATGEVVLRVRRS